MPTALRSRINRALLESMAGTDASMTELQPEDWEGLWIGARDHCLAPYLHKRWCRSGFIAQLPETIAERFATARSQNAARNDGILRQLNELYTALQEKGVASLVLKGLPLAQAYYGDLGLRVLYDLDLLIRTRDRAAAFDAVREIGYEPFSQRPCGNQHQTLFWRPKQCKWDAEGICDPDRPCFVELHTEPWESHWHGFDLECNLDLWKNDRIQDVAGFPLRVPGEERALVHLAVHYACNVLEANARLMHLLDLALLMKIRATALDWDRVVGEIAECHAEPFCVIALDLAQRVSGCRIPGEAWNRLRRATPPGILDWLGLKGMEDVTAMNLHHRDRAVIYFLHWKMAAGWLEKTNMLSYTLRSAWLDGTGAERWKSLALRMVQRLQHISRAARI